MYRSDGVINLFILLLVIILVIAVLGGGVFVIR